MKKLLTMTLCMMIALAMLASSVYATTYNYDSFSTPETYGTKTKVDDNITNLNGNKTETGEKLQGPYSKASTAKLADGITEETYIDLDLEKFAQGEYFEVSLALKTMKDGQEEYVTEQVIMTQKINENEFLLTANGIPSFQLKVNKSGIYTYRWNMYTEDGVTYENFSLYNRDELVGTTGKVNLDEIIGPDTKTPVAEQGDVSVKYLWFVHINAEKGVNVYAELPALEVEQPPVQPEPTPVQPEPTPEEPKDETPKTGSTNMVVYVSTFVAIISLAGIMTIKKYSK